MKKNLILIMLCLVSTSLWAQVGIKNYAQIKVGNGTYFVANNNMNFTNTASGTFEVEGAARLEGTNSNAAGISGVVVRNGANLLQNTDNVNATVQQEILADTWHLLSNPVATLDFYSILAGTYVYEYIENSTGTSNAWLNITSGYMQTDRGYLVQNTGSNRTIDFTGILNNGNMTYPLEYTAALGAGAGYNLVGNPYSCALDWTNATGFDKSNITGAIYIWDNSANAYGTSNGTVYTAPMTSHIIPACQGFIVKATSASNFVINNDAKTLDFTTPLYKSSPDNLLRIRLSGNESFDEMVVYFDSEATPNYDLTKDADKFVNGIANIYTLSDDSYQLAINATNESEKIVPLNFKSNTTGNYTLWVNESTFGNTGIYLEDTQNNTITQLFADTGYNFTHTNPDFENRFLLHFGSVVTDVENTIENQGVTIFSAEKYVNIVNAENCHVEIFDVTGRLHYAGILHSNHEQIRLNTAAVYIVKTMKDNQLITEKVFVQ